MKKSSNQEPVVIELEGDNAFLDAFCISNGHGSIVAIDEILKALPDSDVNKPLLMQFRKNVNDANVQNNFPLLQAWLYALTIGLKAAAALIPLISLSSNGRKKGQPLGAQSNSRRAADARKFVEDENAKMIREGAAQTPPHRYGQDYRAKEIQKKMIDQKLTIGGKTYSIRRIKFLITGT